MAHRDPHHLLELLHRGNQRLIRTVDGFHGDDWTAPSLLPGWSRVHVVAHLALNAEGLAGCLVGIVEGEPTPMYRSQEARDGDIDALAAADHSEVRERLLASCTAYDDAFAALPPDEWDTRVERVPGGMTFSAASTPLMRLREVEIHHADLDAGYSHHDWPMGFTVVLLESMRQREWEAAFRIAPDDLEQTWSYGGSDPGAGPTVSGTAADLGWWLTGRGSGEGLRSSDGTLPPVASW